MDKQIIDLTIIDQKYKDKCSLIKAGKCKNVNIFIEQSRKLKAKEQECETLASQLDFEVQKKECLEQECEKLKENLPNAITRLMGELDQLKEQLEAYKMEAEEGREINAELKAEKEKIEQCIIEQNRLVVGMTKEIETLTFKKYELLQTLTEIEKLAIQGNVYCIDYNIDDCEKCIKQSDCKITLFKQILQIISEVEDG